MSLFTQVKSQITTRQAAEAYGRSVSRNGMACCIFHDDRHPSMKIGERYYCFSCHATGDVIDFTASEHRRPPGAGLPGHRPDVPPGSRVAARCV